MNLRGRASRSKYRVFLASTKADLEKQRMFVAEQLRQADIDVVQMEDWPADAATPDALSVKRLKGCQFCIVLVAFQRGTIAVGDPQGSSIVQLEVAAAEASGAEILYFLLEDTPTNRASWPAQYNKLDELDTVAWRREIQRTRVCQGFQAGSGPDSMPHVLPSVMRAIAEVEAKARKRLQVLILIGTIAALGSLTLIATSEFVRSAVLSRLHTLDDPTVFTGSRDGDYETVRLIDGRSDLLDNTNFREDLLGAQHTFNMFAVQFFTFQDYAREFEEMLQRGVRVRMVLADYSEANRDNLLGFLRAKQDVNPEDGISITSHTVALIRELSAKYPGQFDLRLTRLPIFYSLWVRDEASENALAQLGVHYYAAITNWAYFRLSPVTGGDQFIHLIEQFDEIWKLSEPVED